MLFRIIKGLYNKKSLLRTLMNLELANYSLSGKVLDIGGGVNPSYFNFLKKENGVEIINIDFKSLDKIGKSINLEKDPLPYSDESVDRVLMFNILEHIYNYKYLLSEARRVLKSDGSILGFVPFMINYHPDPHDYFRYTKEALLKIFNETGFDDVVIKEVGLGPFAVNYNVFAALPFPKIIKLLLFPFYYFVDKASLKMRPRLKERYPLGYMFILTK